MDDPKELLKLKNYKPSIDDLKMKEPSTDWFNKQLPSTTLYAFLYNPMIHESSSQTVSIHRTKEGAEKALEWHKSEERKKWNEFSKNDEVYKTEFPFEWNKNWRIQEITVQE
jgi:hypothetical protein